MVAAVVRAGGAGGAGGAVGVARGQAVQGGVRGTAAVSAAVLRLAGCTASLTSCGVVGARGVETPVLGGLRRRHHCCTLWAPLLPVVLALLVFGWC